ncbi:TcpE family conjugal transfer membrane protein [Actinomadura madurae]|uniref:TcpE family conjugal transfer membrane protein n=1 Tax=Actinomadura madurae TaxID=1993 RepID=UPI0020D212F3|nr:TcpE family conjugal transfer membrane protein [Actinomadura madurae]MCP9979459.1 TcpE family conjugal transfer membrane protein [Actinomadura madurae]MCQ0009007.1 TcpE family conjugal transfer membrane protein [Actinomadura madurae]
MDLPTYTNIWRIEKRLYKLYDLRLPMPLPLVQIGVFLGVFVPWIVLLRVVGIPFESPWHVLYIVPPGVLTWMATRPVIEGKRLTELLLSQSRYLSEPRTWCRLTPIREPREVVIVARVWRRAEAPAPAAAMERAAIKSRRRRARDPEPVPIAPPAAAPAPVVPRPAAAAAPPSLVEYAAQREPAVPPKAWRRTTRDISHEDDVLPVAAEIEHPPATPRLEAPPPAAPGSGKRAFASGVRRPGAPAEVWQAEAPPGTRPDIPVPQPAPSVRWVTPAEETFNGEPGDKKVAGHRAPHRDTPSTPRPHATRPDIPMVPGAFGAHPQQQPAHAQEPEQPQGRSPVPSAETVWPPRPAPEQEQAASPGGEPEAQPAHAGAEETRPSARPTRPEQQVVRAQEQPERPEEQRARAQEQPAQEASASPSEEARSGGEAEKPEDEGARSGAGETRPSARPTRPEQQVARAQEQQGVLREPPRPWSKGLSKPMRPAVTDNLMWPPVPEAGAPAAQGTPVQPPAPPPVEEEAPPREVRSQPASPVRPRPLPPPPAPPPSGPAITPPGPEHEVTSGGLRRLIHAVGGGHGEIDAEYQQRIQQPFHGTRHVVVLGCTGGAGQTVTALMLGHTFAQHNGEPVVAIDVNPGPGALARRTRSDTNETLTGLITRADQVNSLTAIRRYTSQAKSGLDVIAAGKNPLQALDDRDYALAIRTLDRFYSVTMLDAAAAVVARVLPYADQIVLVAPASADAPRAVAMTFEWLDGHGYEELRSRAVTVINGVSRRSMDDVEQAEAVARGRCRALVRIPWDDHLSMDRAPRNELKSLRTPTRRAYLALAGVVAGGFTVMPERYQELQQEQEATR